VIRTGYSGRRGGVPSPRALTAPELLRQCSAWRCRGGDGRTGLTVTGMVLPPA
jgi:hypothetical protein